MAQFEGITLVDKPQGNTTAADHGVYEDEGDRSHHHGKKSVLSKVKVLMEKTKKWKGILQRKKHGGHNNGEPIAPISLVDEEDDDQFEDSPEFHDAPMYESEMAPEIYRDSDATDFSPREEKLKLQIDPHQKPINLMVSGILAPAYAMVSAREEEAISKHKWDRGFSVKEYLLQKLEPGEDDRLLCQVISEAIGPKKSVMEKEVKGSEGPPFPISTMPHAGTCSSSPETEPQSKKLPYSSSSFNSIEKKLSLGNSRSPPPVGSRIYPRSNSMNSRFGMLHSSHEGETKGRRNRKKLKDYLN